MMMMIVIILIIITIIILIVVNVLINTHYTVMIPFIMNDSFVPFLMFMEISGESTCLPPLWPGFDSQTRHHVGLVWWFSSLL